MTSGRQLTSWARATTVQLPLMAQAPCQVSGASTPWPAAPRTIHAPEAELVKTRAGRLHAQNGHGQAGTEDVHTRAS